MHDELNTPIRTISYKGESISQHMTDAFGNAVVDVKPKSNQPNLITFTGYEDDIGTGLHFVQARYYMPEIARFTQQDPDKGSILNPQSLAPYVHCYNNATRYVDLDGRMPCCGGSGWTTPIQPQGIQM